MSNRQIANGGSAFGLKPIFANREGWKEWRRAWSALYADLSADIRRKKLAVKELQRSGQAAKHQKALHHDQIVAWKMMSLLDEAKQRWQRILGIERQMAEQNALFPLDIGECATVDFHYNRASNEFPQLPRWVVKAKGKSWYVTSVNANCPFSTKENQNSSTKGLIRFRKCKLVIDVSGCAHISSNGTNLPSMNT